MILPPTFSPYGQRSPRHGVEMHNIHIGIFTNPFLRYVLEGRKTVESRFSKRRIVPYRAVAAGDLLYLKISGGPLVGFCRIANVEFYELDRIVLNELRTRYAEPMCATNTDFWAARAESRYATFMHLEEARPLRPIEYHKRDRRGWVVLARGANE
jgi:hypothetical protein